MVSLKKRFRSLWRRFVDLKIVSPEEIEGALHLPVLAIIPHLERRSVSKPSTSKGPVHRKIDLEGRWRSKLLSHFSSDSSASSVYGTLADELLHYSRTQKRKVFLCVSSVAGEGTSLTCVNLAIAAHRHKIRTLVIEGHTRAPRISAVLDVDLEPGLTGSVHRTIPLSHVIQKSSAGFDVLPAGRSVAYPEALWGTPAFHRILTEVRTLYDVILFETAPALLYKDITVLADQVDAIVFIHQFGRVSAERVEKALEKLGSYRQKVVGIVLNDVPHRIR